MGGGSASLRLRHEGSEGTLADNSNWMPRILHFFCLAVLAALDVPGKDIQILITYDQMRRFPGHTGLYGHADPGSKFSGFISGHAKRAGEDHH